MRNHANCWFDSEPCDCTSNDGFLGEALSRIAALFQGTQC